MNCGPSRCSSTVMLQVVKWPATCRQREQRKGFIGCGSCTQGCGPQSAFGMIFAEKASGLGLGLHPSHSQACGTPVPQFDPHSRKPACLPFDPNAGSLCLCLNQTLHPKPSLKPSTRETSLSHCHSLNPEPRRLGLNEKYRVLVEAQAGFMRRNHNPILLIQPSTVVQPVHQPRP